MLSFRLGLNVGLGVGAALMGASLLLPNFAAPAMAQPNLVPRLQVRISPQFNTYLLARKPRIAAALIDQNFVLREGVPAFKLPDGSERLLLPVGAVEAPAAAGDATIPAELADLRPYILSPVEPGKFRIEAFKINPQLLIPTVVDRRASMMPVRDQGVRGTCVAFATNGALEPFLSIPNDLSEMYAYHQFMAADGQPFNFNKGTYLTTAINVMKQGTVTEAMWPYVNAVPPASEGIPGAANGAAKYKITNAQLITDTGPGGASIKNTNFLEALIRQGYNIVIATGVAWTNAQAQNVIDVTIDPATNQPTASRGGHAMVIVGYDTTKDYFIVRNSWGTGSGHGGYLHMSYDYMRTYMGQGFIIKGVSPNMVIMTPPGNGGFTTIPPIRLPR